MSQAANVRSLEALKEFRVALIKFIDKAKRSISTADSEVQRTSIWLGSTQPMHWIQEVRRAEERLTQAKSELFRATISQPDNPRGPTDQVRLVRKRQEEIKIASDKLQNTKKWSRKFERSLNEYRGAMAPLGSILDGDLQKASSILTNAIKSLEAYVSTTLESQETVDNDFTNKESIARKGDDQQDEHSCSDSTTDEGD